MRRKSKRPPLPPSCALCRPHGGLWRDYGTADKPQLDRCDCPRGKALGLGTRWGKPPRKPREVRPFAPASDTGGES
jgi:hypothetical protein